VLFRVLVIGDVPPKCGQVAFRSQCTGMSGSEDVANALKRVPEKSFGKYQFVSRGSATPDRTRVSVSQTEAYVMVGAERASRQGEHSAREHLRLTEVVCCVECN